MSYENFSLQLLTGIIRRLGDKFIVEYDQLLKHAGLNKKGTGPGEHMQIFATNQHEIFPDEKYNLLSKGDYVSFQLKYKNILENGDVEFYEPDNVPLDVLRKNIHNDKNKSLIAFIKKIN